MAPSVMFQKVADTCVVSHADATGADAYNPALSSRRA
jgi:outer membrane protein OmpA-like peptidoglycan-associated protein